MGVAVVVKAVVFKARLLGDISSKLLDALQRFVGCVTGEQVSFPRAGPLPHFGEQGQSRSG